MIRPKGSLRAFFIACRLCIHNNQKSRRNCPPTMHHTLAQSVRDHPVTDLVLLKSTPRPIAFCTRLPRDRSCPIKSHTTTDCFLYEVAPRPILPCEKPTPRPIVFCTRSPRDRSCPVKSPPHDRLFSVRGCPRDRSSSATNNPHNQ